LIGPGLFATLGLYSWMMRQKSSNPICYVSSVVAKNLNFALQRLNEISLQMAQLTSLSGRLPDEFRDLLYERAHCQQALVISAKTIALE
jgi:hypothetical protein